MSILFKDIIDAKKKRVDELKENERVILYEKAEELRTRLLEFRNICKDILDTYKYLRLSDLVEERDMCVDTYHDTFMCVCRWSGRSGNSYYGIDNKDFPEEKSRLTYTSDGRFVFAFRRRSDVTYEDRDIMSIDFVQESNVYLEACNERMSSFINEIETMQEKIIIHINSFKD